MTRAQTIELKTAPEIDAIIAAAAPGYRKKTATLAQFAGSMTVNSYWDSGSKSSYALVDLATRRARPLGGSSHPFFDVRARGHANQTTPDGTLTTDAAGTGHHCHASSDGFINVSQCDGTTCGTCLTDSASAAGASARRVGATAAAPRGEQE